jgi:hypothetical protein
MDLQKDLQESLREIFLINLSDPNSSPEVLFKSVFNLLVFYHVPKSGELQINKASLGTEFYEYWNKVKQQTNLPLIFYNELDFLGANLYYLSGNTN